MDLAALLPNQRPLAEAANLVLKTRFGLKDGEVNKPICKSLNWRPTILWITKTEYIACEVADRPYPTSIRLLYGDIAATGLPIRVIAAYPSPSTLTTRDYQIDVASAKKSGVGFLSVTDNQTGQLENPGIPISLFLAKPDIKKFRKCLAKPIGDAYDLYINGEPRHGVQELGQTVESALVALATQARRKRTFTTGGYSPGSYYPFATLVDDLVVDRVIGRAILGKCRGFVDDRNGTSHKPKSIKQAEKISRKLRDCFALGLQILEELPLACKDKGYKFAV
jgi:hypothetical protein